MQLQSSAKDQLRTIVARIERLEEERAALAADLREVYAEAKGNGFDTKALKTGDPHPQAGREQAARGRGRACHLPSRARHGRRRGRSGLAVRLVKMPSARGTPASQGGLRIAA